MMMNVPLKLLSGLLIIGLAACASKTGYEDSTVWGRRGTKAGLFSSPRAVETDGNEVAVIDRTGRVQFFKPDGTFLRQWTLEKIANGTPTGLEFDHDGTLWIPDTHNSRMLHYTKEGERLFAFGSFGKTNGHFVYPTDAAVNENGELFVTEYGSDDRVQVFTREGEYIRGWGAFGSGDDQFNRPMAIEIGPDGHLYIADAVNHRVKVYTQEGELVRIFGEEGKKPGQLNFPYDLTFGAQGRLWVLEFGSHRVQQFTVEGRHLQTLGAMGSEPGQLVEPWGLDCLQDALFIADTRNHRITLFHNVAP